MEIEILTKQDLQLFRLQLLDDLKKVLQPEAPKKWLRSSEVRALLKIAPSTLQSLRIKGVLHPSKIGGTFYYEQAELQKLLQQGNQKLYKALKA